MGRRTGRPTSLESEVYTGTGVVMVPGDVGGDEGTPVLQ